ncbi:thiol peroxidase [Anaerococcus prevotii]|uniref:Redoxin family protein n=1 Tax=Anaerococcus prevotii ACS-065-V-Col13 TaxID=879305 RepID=F0GWM7_9FIRM|nr:thiol peroxidase [Anaerococcus prevotii]EGC81847.1 redoxin family protein [Anaerococcus prevotii ACS-065-V-Col13]
MSRKIKFGTIDVTVDGEKLQVGDFAPEFRAINNDLSDYSSKEDEGKIRLISVIPSIDTSVCEIQTTMFTKAAENFSDDVVLITISNDLPFAQARFSEDKEISNNKFISDYIYNDFSKKYSTLINELQLLNRSVFVVDKDNKIVYSEYLDQNTDLPEYEKAIEIVKDLDK